MERYSIIFDRMHNLYAKDTKIIIERAVITKDNDTGELFAQIKMSNLFPKTLVAVKVILTGFDSSNKKIEEKEFSYFIPYFLVDYRKWNVVGEYIEYNYEVKDENDYLIGRIEKRS